MNMQILYPGNDSLVQVDLDAGEVIKAESGAMVAMAPTIDVEGKLEGGVMAGFGRMLAGEKFFFQTLRAARGPGQVLLAASTPGDTILLELDGYSDYILQKDGFLAATDGVVVETTMQNLTRGLFSGEGFFIIKVSGKGTLAVSSFGAIHGFELGPGEEYIVDNAHLVAWSATTTYTIEKASKSGWLSSLTSGEGLVCRFRGPGRVYIQSRNKAAFGSWVRTVIPSR